MINKTVSVPTSAQDLQKTSEPLKALTNDEQFDWEKYFSTNNTVIRYNEVKTDYTISVPIGKTLVTFPCHFHFPALQLMASAVNYNDVLLYDESHANLNEVMTSWEINQQAFSVDISQPNISLSSFVNVVCVDRNNYNCSLSTPLTNLLTVISTTTEDNTVMYINFNGEPNFVTSLLKPNHAMTFVPYVSNITVSSEFDDVDHDANYRKLAVAQSPSPSSCVGVSFDGSDLSRSCYLIESGFLKLEFFIDKYMSLNAAAAWRLSDRGYSFFGAKFNFFVDEFGIKNMFNSKFVYDEAKRFVDMSLHVKEGSSSIFDAISKVSWSDPASAVVTGTTTLYGKYRQLGEVGISGKFNLDDTGSRYFFSASTDRLDASFINNFVSSNSIVMNVTKDGEIGYVALTTALSLVRTEWWDLQNSLHFQNGKYVVLLTESVGLSSVDITGSYHGEPNHWYVIVQYNFIHVFDSVITSLTLLNYCQ